MHIGDIDNQLHKMFSNVEQLLSSEGCGVDYITNAVAYLKRAEDVAAFQRLRDPADFQAIS